MENNKAGLNDQDRASEDCSAGGRLQQSVIKNALNDLDWTALKAHIDQTGLGNGGLDFLLGHLRRTSSLIMPYPKPTRENRREFFFSSLIAYVGSLLGNDEALAVRKETEQIKQIEQGYRGILTLLSDCDISQLPPEIRVSACLSRAAHSYSSLTKQVNDAFRTRQEIALPRGPLLASEGVFPVAPDAALAAIVESTTDTLQMEGFKNTWFDGDGFLVLPKLPDVGEDERFKSGSNELLAIWWRRWRRTEERLRYLGGTLTTFAEPELPAWSPKGVKQVMTYDPRQNDVFDYIANERLNDRLGTTLVEMMVETDIEAKATGIESAVPLLPQAFVTVSEAHSAVSLCETLNYDIATDEEAPGGLKLVEWLRGYSVLNTIAQDRSQKGTDAANVIFVIQSGELINVLERCGLQSQSAKLFLDAATLKASSRDLFDCPLIRLTDGSLLVFGPGLISANPARIILSQIANLGEPLSRKGKAFEREILRFLQSQNLAAKSFKVNRGGQEYEYDVVVAWDNYVFVLECKNHSLSNHHPVQAYYFELQMRSSAKQVKRLADNLLGNPDILQEQLGIDVTHKTVIPCVLNSLPYALPGRVDGVYFTDASALRRFFRERYVHVNSPHRVTETIKILHRTAMSSLWAGDTPSAEDFIRQLEDPFQIKALLAHIALAATPFAIGRTEVVYANQFVRKELSIESISDLVGVSAKNVRNERLQITKQVKKLKERLSRRKRKFNK